MTNQSRRIVMAGAGAIGLYYGGRLLAAGHDVRFWARGANREHLLKLGVTVTSIEGDVQSSPVRASEQLSDLVEEAELIVLGVKCYDSEWVIEELAKSKIAPGCMILSLQNGVDNEEKLARRFGAEKVLGGAAFIGSERIGPGHVEHTAAGHIVVGAWDDGRHAVAEEWDGLFRAAGIKSRCSATIRAELWHKLLWNIGFNTTTALTGTFAADLLAFAEGEALVRRLMAEAIAVAAGEGVALDPQAVDGYIERTSKMGPVRTSMLVDREHGRRLEYQALCGVVVDRGVALGLDVSAAQTIYALLKAVDQSHTS